MFSDWTFSQYMLLLVGGVAAHLILLLLSRKVNVLYVLASVVVVLAPYSAAPGLGTVGILVRYIRGYALILLLLAGFFKFRRGTLRAAALIWLVFAVGYLLAGSYSLLPLNALSYKGQFVLVVLGGVFLAYGTRDRDDLMRGLRFVNLVAGLMAAIVLGHFLVNPSSFMILHRASVFGVLPTRIASDLAAILLVSTFLALHEPSSFWRSLAYISCAAGALMIAVTGSRGPAAVVVAAFLVQLLPQTGHRIRMLMLPAFVALVGFLLLEASGSEADVSRLVSTQDTRTEKWSTITEIIQEKPLLGHGWVGAPSSRTSVAVVNAHNIALQVAMDMGAMGVVFFTVCLSAVGYLAMRMYRFVRRQRLLAEMAILPISLIASGLVEGLVSSSPLFPSSFAMTMALAIGLVDRLPEIATVEKCRAFHAVRIAQFRQRALRAAPRRGALPKQV